MADFIPVHVTKDGTDTDGLREYSTSDDIAVTNDLRFKDNNTPVLYFSNENGNDYSSIESFRQWSSAWQNVIEIKVKNQSGSQRTGIKVWGNGDVEFGTSGNGAAKFHQPLQLSRTSSTYSSHNSPSVTDFLGGTLWFATGDNKLTYYDGTSNQFVASEAWVTANAGGASIGTVLALSG